MPDTVSVAVATYMGSAFVLDQLRSILEQTLPPTEIVVCDDRSSDGTAQLIAEFATTSPVPVRLVVNDERLGWRANFMKAASLCESEIIAFCDQDDVWDARKLERVVAGFERAETLVVFHDATIVGADLSPIGPFLQGAGEPDRAGVLERGPWRDVYGFTMAFRRDLLVLWSYWPSSLDKSVGRQPAAHDQWLLFLGAALGETRHVPESLVRYRQHDRNAVGAKDAVRPITRLDAFLGYRDVVNLRLVVLDSRIRILDGIVRDHDGLRAAATAAATTHRAYRTRLALQTAVYSAKRLPTRLRAYGALLSRGSYSSSPWALGRLAVIEDGAAAVLGPTVLARLRRAASRGADTGSRSSSRPVAGRQSQSP